MYVTGERNIAFDLKSVTAVKSTMTTSLNSKGNIIIYQVCDKREQVHLSKCSFVSSSAIEMYSHNVLLMFMPSVQRWTRLKTMHEKSCRK